MQLPDNFRAFEKTTYIVVTDNVHAKIFKASGHNISHVDTITSDYPSKENPERYSGMTPSGMHSAEQSEKTDETSREKLYHALSKDLMQRRQNLEFTDLVFAVPEENANEFNESMHITLLKNTKGVVRKNLVNHDMQDIVMHVQEEI